MKHTNRAPAPRLAMTAVALAVLALTHQAQAQPFYHFIDSQKMFNLTGGYTGFKRLKLSGGISNLFNVDPPLSNQRIGSRVAFAQNVSKPIGRTHTFKGVYSF